MAKKRVDPNINVGRIKLNQEVLSFKEYNTKGRSVYKIKCNFCNNEYESTIDVFRDARKSGSCCRKCQNSQHKIYESMTVPESQLSLNYSNYRSKAKMKKWEFNLTKEEFKTLVTSNCHYCGLEPNQFRTDRIKSIREGDSSFLMNGIDRVDSSLGYTTSNTLPCCEDCNKAKRNLSYNQFLDLIKKIYEYKSLNK